MQIKLSGLAKKQIKNLPEDIRKKTRKQFGYLLEDIRHPSLHAKKYQVQGDIWQGRIDQNWRFYFHIVTPHYVIVSIITHPK